MSTPNLNYDSHSADVRIDLFLNGHVLPVAQLGPDYLTLRVPADHPPADAEIAMQIDGHESRWPVRLVDGLSKSQQRTRIGSRDARLNRLPLT